MPTLKAKELRSLSTGELTERAENLKKDLFTLRVQAKLGKLENLLILKQTRRDLGKILTVRRELELKENG